MSMALVALVYVGFAAMGLPEALLGASWPAMGSGLHAPLAAVIGISVVIAAGAMWAALAGEPWLRRWGSGRSVDVGVACTVVALLGFSFTPSYWLLLFFAVPYGVGSGLLALALNAYIALRLPSAHIIWMHATTAAGAMAGHTMLGWIIANDADWRWAYRCIGLVQLALAIVLVSATKLWRDELTPIQRAAFGMQTYGERDWRVDAHVHGRLGASLRLRGALPTLLLLFAYASVEQSTMLWASSYMVHADHMSIHYAGIYANLFFIGLTLGSVIAGCLALRLSDGALLGGGLGILVAALVVMIVPMGSWRALTAPIMLGVGCAPINPAVVHMTPRLFGAVHTMTMIGWETAVIAVATLVSPALFAVFSATVGMAALPWYLACFTSLGILAAVILMSVSHLQSQVR